MSAPARSCSVAWAGQASASLAYMTPPNTHTTHSWSQELLQLLLFRPQSKELGAVLRDRTNARREDSKEKLKERRRKEDWTGVLRERRREVVDEMTGTGKTCTQECALMTGVITNKPWMDNIAVRRQLQSDNNFAERAVTKKLESRLIWGKLMQSEGQFGWKTSPRTHFLLYLTVSCLFSSKERHNIIT